MLTKEQLFNALPHRLDRIDLDGFGPKIEGKVRDSYDLNGRRILVTTDRVSAFDRVLGLIPYKGQVLNQLSAWWFEQTADILANHLIEVPDPNVTIAHIAQPLPVEIVVRGYITGVTTTSLWYLYENGDRRPYGIELPDGMQKNDPLPQPMITPTTKAEKGQHDERLTRQEILERGLVKSKLWQEIETAAIQLFKRGQALAAKAGLILVDTKYEMGLVEGQLTLIDEIHTPDSSRYWIGEPKPDKFQKSSSDYPVPLHPVWSKTGVPENYDKEFMRKWFAAQGYRGEGTPPVLPDDFIIQIAERYIGAYERLTGKTFEPGDYPVHERIKKNLTQYDLTQRRKGLKC